MELQKIFIRELERTDIEKLVQFFSRVYGYKQNDFKFLQEFYHWKYIINRALYSNGTASLIGVKDERIVGFIGALNFMLRTNSGLKSAVWIADWMVDKEHSPPGLGRLLLQNLMENNENVIVTGTEMSHTGKHILEKFNFTSSVVGIHSYCYLNTGSIKKLYSKKGLWLLLSQLIQGLNKLIYHDRLVFTESKLEQLELPAETKHGLAIDKSYLRWIAESPAFTGQFYAVSYKQKKVGYLLVQPFQKNGRRHIRVLDYVITDGNRFNFLQKIKVFYKQYDIISIKQTPGMKMKSFLCGFYNSKATFWYPEQIKGSLNFNNFFVSNLEKDAAFRGVNKIV